MPTGAEVQDEFYHRESVRFHVERLYHPKFSPLDELQRSREDNEHLMNMHIKSRGIAEGSLNYADFVVRLVQQEAARFMEQAETETDPQTKGFLKGLAARAMTTATQIRDLASGYERIKQASTQLGGHGGCL